MFYIDRGNCIYSYKAIELLKGKQKSFKGYLIKRNRGGEDKLNELLYCLEKNKNQTHFNAKHYTLPIIFYRGKFIGGSDDLRSFASRL